MTFTTSPSLQSLEYIIKQFQFLRLAPYHPICSTDWEAELGNLIPDPAVAAGELVAGRCDNDTTHQLRRDFGPRLRQLLIIDGSRGPGLASNCITGHFSIAICESCGDVCWVAINSQCAEM